MARIQWLVLCAALLAPASSWALGASLSAGAGVISSGSTDFKAALELSPFYERWRLRFEVPVELRLEPSGGGVLAVRPGLKAFIPPSGLYARGGYALGNLGGSGALSHGVILGVGWQAALLDLVSVFFEGTAEPQIAPTGAFTGMFRAGVLLDL